MLGAPLSRSLRHAPLAVALALAAVAACGDDGNSNTGAGGEGAGTTATSSQVSTSSSSTGQGGEGGQWGLAPPLRNPVDMPDSDLAYEALKLMGYTPLGATASTCSECHSINRGLMTYWRDLTDTAVADCFADTTIPSKIAAEDALACLKMKPEVATSPFTTSKLGIYAAAGHLDWFEFVFARAFDNQGDDERADFLMKVAMPKQPGETPLTQPEFDIVAEWFARGLPFMEDFLPEGPLPGGCEPNITPGVATYVDQLATTGWHAENAADNILMFGCAGAPTPLDCLAAFPQAGTLAFGTGWEHYPGAKLRVLRTNDFPSSYWTRSSADGRFVGMGGGQFAGSTIVDLVSSAEIPVDAAYDPGFFPDNSGFIFQGTDNGTGICRQSLLLAPPPVVLFSEPECNNSASVGLYQHVGAALGGGDYWAVDSPFVSDNGGHNPTDEQPAAFFDQGADIDLTPMIYDGSEFIPKPMVSVDTPYEGDTVMSPSSGLLISRVAGQGFNQNGFRLRRMVATPNGNSYTITAPEVARYCVNGGKPGFSFDERWAVIHRYVEDADAEELGFTGPGDPGFAPYASSGAANIYLLDLKTGLLRRITHMKPGQYALFPHFRSDGWIYFMVRNMNATEYIVASDAALVIENQ